MHETPPFPVRRFTVADYEAMGEAGILTEDDKVELLDGWIVQKSAKNPARAATIDQLCMEIRKLLPPGWYVRSCGAVVTSDSVPEPDLTIVRGKPADHRRRHPHGAEVGIIVQVAEGSVASDRAKADIYACADIPHYWIVNLDDGQVEVYSEPSGAGRKRVYSDRKVLRGKSAVEVILDSKIIGSLSVREILN
jgi:Uma2 family endonuclease